MATPRTVLVVNPRSQGGRLGKRWKDLADTIGRAFPFDEVITESPGDAIRLTREALQAGAERVVAIGGDGTMASAFESGSPHIRASRCTSPRCTAPG
jgi:diacylglycerol kinase family enzyme